MAEADESRLGGSARLDLYNESISPAEADCIAIYSDWIMVRKDLEAALSETSDLAK